MTPEEFNAVERWQFSMVEKVIGLPASTNLRTVF